MKAAILAGGLGALISDGTHHETFFYRKNIFTGGIELINKRPNYSSFQFSPIFYSFCVESFSLKNHNKTISEIINFVVSKDFRFTMKIFGFVHE